MRRIATPVGASVGANDYPTVGAIVGAIVHPNVWGRGKPAEPFFPSAHTGHHNPNFPLTERLGERK